MPYIYSTATCSGTYCDYGPIDKNAGQNIARKKVTIKGGHGVASQARGPSMGGIYTPIGVVTEVSDSDLEFLLANKSFQRHMAAGFMTVDKKKVEPAKKAIDMAQKDGSAPVTLKDFEDSESSEPGLRILKAKPQQDPIVEEIVQKPKHKSRK